jgi:hypothetical protein
MHFRYYQEHENTIARLVIDECHQMVTSASYQPKFTKLNELAQFPAQRCYLTATCPPNLIDGFLKMNYLPNSTVII